MQHPLHVQWNKLLFSWHFKSQNKGMNPVILTTSDSDHIWYSSNWIMQAEKFFNGKAI